MKLIANGRVLRQIIEISPILARKRIPFDWANPVGYLTAVIIEYIIGGYQYLLNSCTLGLGIGAFWFAVTATKEIRCILRSINVKAKAKNCQSSELMVLFAEFIDVHGIVKQLSTCNLLQSFEWLTNIVFCRVEHDFSGILQPIFMSLFAWSLLWYLLPCSFFKWK